MKKIILSIVLLLFITPLSFARIKIIDYKIEDQTKFWEICISGYLFVVVEVGSHFIQEYEIQLKQVFNERRAVKCNCK